MAEIRNIRKEVLLITTTQIDIGLRTIAAQLGEGYQCKYLNTSRIEIIKIDSTIFKKILAFCSTADFVLFTAVDFRYGNVRVLADAIRERLKIPVIIGGIHAILYPEDCINDCNALCIGEADFLIKKLLDHWDERYSFYIPNFWYNLETKIVKTERQNLVTDLNNLPTPDFSFDNYFIADQKVIIPINNIKYYKYQHHQIGHPSTLVYSSDRGCPHSCSYCYNSNLQKIFGIKNYYRKKSIEKIITELAFIINTTRNKYHFINIMNDNMASRTEHELELFARLYSEEIGIPFYCMVSPMELTKSKLKSIVEAGCVELNIGIQTNEKTNLEIYNRRQSNYQIYQVSEMLLEHSPKIKVFYDLIINNPLEKHDSLIETIQLIRKLIKPFDIVTHHLCIGNNTILFNKIYKNGIIHNENIRINNSDFHDFEKHIVDYLKWDTFFENLLIEWLAGPHNKQTTGRLQKEYKNFINSTFIFEWVNQHDDLQNLINESKVFETIDFFLENIDFFKANKELLLLLNKLLPSVKYSNFENIKLVKQTMGTVD
ncbi:MAG: radical SAM protein [Bacteroidales bacterium]|nr:radical SAM protein [Bacteroidales bacterium]